MLSKTNLLEDYIAAAVVAERKGLAVRTISEAIRKGLIPAVKVQGRYYVLESEVRKWQPKSKNTRRR
jgi:predicted site-specific integrase-resolvase